MKKRNLFLLTLLAIISVTNLNSQNKKNEDPPYSLYTNENGSFVFDTVIEIAEITKSELYKRAKNWVISNVRSNDKTVIFDDENNEEIRTDVTTALGKFPGVSINFKLAIYFKDGKCKINCESFAYQYIGSGTLYEEDFAKVKVMGKKMVYKALTRSLLL